MLASRRSNTLKGGMTVTSLVESHTLDIVARREDSLFTSLIFCNVISCSLRSKENIRCSMYLCFIDRVVAMIKLY